MGDHSATHGNIVLKKESRSRLMADIEWCCNCWEVGEWLKELIVGIWWRAGIKCSLRTNKEGVFWCDSYFHHGRQKLFLAWWLFLAWMTKNNGFWKFGTYFSRVAIFRLGDKEWRIWGSIRWKHLIGDQIKYKHWPIDKCLISDPLRVKIFDGPIRKRPQGA